MIRLEKSGYSILPLNSDGFHEAVIQPVLQAHKGQNRPSGFSEKSGRQTVSFNYCTHIGYNRTPFDYNLQAIFNNSFTLRAYKRAPIYLSLTFKTSK